MIHPFSFFHSNSVSFLFLLNYIYLIKIFRAASPSLATRNQLEFIDKPVKEKTNQAKPQYIFEPYTQHIKHLQKQQQKPSVDQEQYQQPLEGSIAPYEEKYDYFPHNYEVRFYCLCTVFMV